MYGSLGATRELSGRSLGALWELVAVAGIVRYMHSLIGADTSNETGLSEPKYS